MRSLRRFILRWVLLFLLCLVLLILRGLLVLPPAPLPSVLKAATWSSSSVFTSFYLKDVQFSSSSGYGLGLVVAAGSVVYGWL